VWRWLSVAVALVVLVPGVVLFESTVAAPPAEAQTAPPVTIPASGDSANPPKVCSGMTIGGADGGVPTTVYPGNFSNKYQIWFGSAYFPAGTNAVSVDWVISGGDSWSAPAGVWPSIVVDPVGAPVTEPGFFPVSSPGQVTQSYSIPIGQAGWYRVGFSVGEFIVNGWSWRATMTIANQQGCSPSVVERTQSCNEASPGLGDGSAGVGKPVSTAAGAEVMSAVDLEVPSRGGQLSVGRCYNSLLSGSSGSLGPGWSWNWSSRVQVDAPSAGEVTVWQPGGGPVVFSPAPNSSGGVAGYVAGPWVSATLVRESASVWAFTLLDGTRYRYAASGPVPGRLVSVMRLTPERGHSILG
jgi:hypothetical protein